MIEDFTPGPFEELKRADHLVYVSLKYTRTVDVMKNAIQRLISAYEMAFSEVLDKAYQEGKISDMPESPKQMAEVTSVLLGKSAAKHLRLYHLLKRIDKSEFSASSEFRKDLTLHVFVPRKMEVKMVDLFIYLERTTDFVKFTQGYLQGPKT